MANLDNLVQNPAMLNISDQASRDLAVSQLIKIIKRKYDNLITVFSLDMSGDDSAGPDIEMAILKAFLNSQKVKYYDNLVLATYWNRIDIARNDIFNGDEVFKANELENLLELALVLNKPDFVELILESNLNIFQFLTYKRLYFLYNSELVSFYLLFLYVNTMFITAIFLI